MGYEWVSGRNNGAPDGSLSPVTCWYTPTLAPVTALSVPSPNGHGDVLERIEVAFWATLSFGDLAPFTFLPQALSTSIIAEVGAVGGSALDPIATGAGGFAFTDEVSWDFQVLSYNYLVSINPTYMRATTHGYRTSHARRGPASYGGVAPAVNVGIVSRGSEYLAATPTAYSAFWSLSVRALWRTP